MTRVTRAGQTVADVQAGFADAWSAWPVMLCGFRFGDLYTSYHRVYYYLYGHGGNVEGILDAGGNLLVRYTYDAWGNFTESVNTSDPGALAALALNPFRYRGYVYDYETGFYYLQSRYYDPETGRFISADSYVSTGTGLLGCNMFFNLI